MSGGDNALKVHIMDKEYLVACPKEEEEALLASARFLSEKMSDIRERGKVVGIDRIAVMAALNLAHELIESGARNSDELDSCGERIEQLNARIGEALERYRIAGLN